MKQDMDKFSTFILIILCTLSSKNAVLYLVIDQRPNKS